MGFVRGIVTHPATPSRHVSPSTGLCTAAGPLQLTLAILKPDLVQHPPNLRQVHRIIIEQDFLVIRSKEPSNNDINQSLIMKHDEQCYYCSNSPMLTLNIGIKSHL